MAKVKILTDSCSDLPKDLREAHGVDYCRMNTVYQGKETPASLDFEYYTPKELYDVMRNGERVTTTQVPPEEFERVFTKYLEDVFDIVYIGCSLKQSSSVNTGEMVARGLREKYPLREIYCIDSLIACMGEGLLAMRAGDYAASGMSAKEIAEKISAERNTVNQFCTVHSLDMLRKAGRVKASSAFFGNLFGVKPILIADKAGNQTPIKKVKGQRSALAEIVNLMKDAITDPKNATVYIVHADAIEDAKEVEAMVKETIGCETYIGYIGPIIGASIGPGAIALYAFGKEVTFEG